MERKYRRDLASRSVDVRGVRESAVDAWPDGNTQELEAIWDRIIEDLGSDYDGCSNVSSIGWAA
ncbi:hypothetical protein [Streptomyces anulatus]|uniref:hypothetical protein n=1 Tax=Streptomyces TaxID=1883 RepID=UPI000A7819EB|nr:hypothetical protein [Streptomyces anulatus]RPK87311.1 hypothetical protein EES46_19670 [Streptomyces sp. ADI98-10]